MRTPPLLLALVLLAACDGGSGDAAAADAGDAASPPMDGAADAILDAAAADAGREPGEPCQPGGCRRGECVHGVCSTVCAADQDCGDPALVCVARGGAGRCTRRCATGADCDGLVCAVDGPERGFCVAPGPGSPGAACEVREDCTGWICSGGVCLALCQDGTCGPGQACLPLHTQSVCVAAGAGADEAPCAAGADCATGVCRGGRCTAACPAGDCPNDRVCITYDGVRLCERRCADSADCAGTGLCVAAGVERLCVTRGPVAAGGACADDRDCADGHCAAGTCAPPCDASGCAPGRACVADIGGATCRPAGPAPLGGTCAQHGDCATAFCAAGTCSVACADGAPCPAGLRCTRFADGEFCFASCRRDEDCPSPAYCEVDFAEGATCFWRGPGAPGDACAAHRDCASGRCAGVCLEPCPGGRCAAGTRCRDFGTGPFCCAEPLPFGAACDAEDACASGLSCVVGRCLPACGAGCPRGTVCKDGHCHPACAADDDCRPGRRCNYFDLPVPFCEAPGERPAEAPCALSAQCASGLCFDGRCRSPCAAGCEPATACVRLAGGGWCLPAGDAPIGAACAENASCADGICVGRRCAGPCVDGACPADTTCRRLRGGDFCVHPCDPAAQTGCGPGEVCSPQGRCALAGGGAAPGEACERLDDCAEDAAACLDAGEGARCRAPCPVGAAGACPADAACAPIATGWPGACVPAGAAGDLAPCAAHGDCESGWCLTGYLGGRCGRPCDPAQDTCGAGARCVDLARDPLNPFYTCAPRCADAGGCPPGLACRLNPTHGEGAAACY